jgi:quercetin dioxygenase-like cupin family protein
MGNLTHSESIQNRIDRTAMSPQTIPPDDLKRDTTWSKPLNRQYIGLAGNTYAITVSGAQTGGQFCVMEMFIPPGGGPPPHRHDFEETFILLEGELELSFRDQKIVARAGETVNIPANAPHRFQNVSAAPVRMICICSPAGQDEFFQEIGVPVATSTTPPPPMDDDARAASLKKAMSLAPKYRTEFLTGV